MSLDLTFAFDPDGSLVPGFLGSSRLAFHAARAMRIALKDNSAIRLVKDYFPKGVHWYDDEGLQYIKTDPYGADLTFTSAGNLTEVFGEIAEGPGAQFMDWDRAVVAFIATLPADTDVLLYWH